MSLTLDQRTNHDGVPKAAELIEAGRAARLAKKIDDAKAIYNEVVTKYPKTASMTEAQVRLAEITTGS